MDEHVVQSGGGEVVAQRLQRKPVIAGREGQFVQADALAGLRETPWCAEVGDASVHDFMVLSGRVPGTLRADVSTSPAGQDLGAHGPPVDWNALASVISEIKGR